MSRSEAQKRAQKKYERTKKAKARMKKYRQTEKGKAALLRANRRYLEKKKARKKSNAKDPAIAAQSQTLDHCVGGAGPDLE